MTDATQLQLSTNVPIPVSTMLTAEDIVFIQRMIDERIDARKSRNVGVSYSYHTIGAIRELIRKHLPEFRQVVGREPFNLHHLRFFLRQKTELLPGDLEVNPSDDMTCRFDRQVANAISNGAWPSSPFVKDDDRKGYFRLVSHD